MCVSPYNELVRAFVREMACVCGYHDLGLACHFQRWCGKHHGQLSPQQ